MMTSLRARRGVAAIATFVVVAGVGVASQVAAEFDVVSVKPNTAGGRSRVLTQPGGRLIATNASLRQLVRFAYRLQDSQIDGGPDWFDTRRFDVIATAGIALPASPLEAPLGPFHQMFQALLATRFGLVAHTEQRERSIYALTRARRDRLGPALALSKLDCRSETAGAEERCERTAGPGLIRATGATLDQLASVLSLRLDRPVWDRTGLSGTYDFELQFQQDPKGGISTIDSGGAALVTALGEQLGLKLDARREPIPVLIVDRASLPAPD